MEELRFEIAEDMEDERIDKCISLLAEELSRSFIQKLIKDGNVLVNGKPVKVYLLFVQGTNVLLFI